MATCRPWKPPCPWQHSRAIRGIGGASKNHAHKHWQHARQRVTVEGAVTNPGIFPIATQLSLLQGIALAKGPTNVAAEHDVIVFRTIGGERRLARFDLDAIREGKALDPELLGEDIVVVGESGGKVLLRRFIELTPLIGVYSLFRGTRVK